MVPRSEPAKNKHTQNRKGKARLLTHQYNEGTPAEAVHMLLHIETYGAHRPLAKIRRDSVLCDSQESMQEGWQE